MPFQIQLSRFIERCALEKALVGSLDGYFFPSKQLPALDQTSSCCTVNLLYTLAKRYIGDKIATINFQHYQIYSHFSSFTSNNFSKLGIEPGAGRSGSKYASYCTMLPLHRYHCLMLWSRATFYFSNCTSLACHFQQMVAGLIRSAEMISCKYFLRELMSLGGRFLSLFKSNWDEASKSSLRIDHCSSSSIITRIVIQVALRESSGHPLT